jgi:hypothetical protein
MKECTNCKTELPDDEKYCPVCGQDQSEAAPQATSGTGTGTSLGDVVTSIPAGPVIATVSFGGSSFPLIEGQRLTIARKDSDRCTPDLGIDADGVSATPIEVRVENGKVVVRDTGTTHGIRVVKDLKPNNEMEVMPGEMLMLGKAGVVIS